MKFLKQIKYEIRNILKSKFLLIISIVVLAASVAFPVISVVAAKLQSNGGGGVVRPMPIEKAFAVKMAAGSYFGGGGDGQESITVDGITINSDNPLYWQIKGNMQEKDMVETDKTRFSTPEALDMYQSLLDEEIHYYLTFAQGITKPQDYRMELVWMSMDSLYDKFIFDHIDTEPSVLLEVVGYRRGMDEQTLNKKYLNLTAEQRQAAYIKADERLSTVFAIAENNDFPKYIELRLGQANDQIASLQENIAIQEQAIIDNPSQEETLNQIIEDNKKQIQTIETGTIPVLQYRLEKNIVPGDESWQNNALNDVENSRNQLVYTTIIKEEEFNQNTGLLQQYKTYQKYVDTVQRQIDQLNNTVVVAQSSLDADKPDMKYVPNSARGKTVGFLDYSVFVALFGVLLGGWIIASEYQQGTIRLLMIRPKTRSKILLSKFTAAFVICLVIYLAGSVLNLLANGICFGFSDFAFPNYSISGPIGFAAYYIPKLLACVLPILFGFTVAFMLSVLTKNIAVSIAVPVVCFVGCFIAMMTFAYRSAMEWIAFTPVPFVQISQFFTQNSMVQMAIQNGVTFSLPYGIGLLVALSAVCTFVSIFVFKKRDIAN